MGRLFYRVNSYQSSVISKKQQPRIAQTPVKQKIQKDIAAKSMQLIFSLNAPGLIEIKLERLA
jgi:hypothetical protein